MVLTGLKGSRLQLLILLLVVTSLLSGCFGNLETKDPIPEAPDQFTLGDHTADYSKTLEEGRYKNSLHISVLDIQDAIDYADDVQVEISKDGITFTNPAMEHDKGAGNRYLKFGYRDGQGILNLMALEGSGKIGVDVYGTIDLSHEKATNNAIVTVKVDDQQVSNDFRTKWSDINYHEDEIFATEMTHGVDNAYVEITIPQQGKATIKDIYIYLETEVIGFSDMAERITGGEGASDENIHQVHNANEFFAALELAKQATPEPFIIEVAGEISYADWSGSDRMFDLGGSDMANLTVRGIGTTGIIDGLGMKIHGHNIIIENLTIRKVLGRDGIEINGATDVWIRHNTLYNEPMSENSDKDKYDELIAIKNDAQHVILSWNHLYDSHKTILIGSNDHVDALPDRKVIMHHNWIQNSGSRMPLFRGGHGHIYNNYFENVNSGINARTGSKIRIEANYFQDIRKPIGYWYDTENPSGQWEVKDNVFAGNYEPANAPIESTTTINFADYTYELDDVLSIPDIVKNGAGVGKI